MSYIGKDFFNVKYRSVETDTIEIKEFRDGNEAEPFAKEIVESGKAHGAHMERANLLLTFQANRIVTRKDTGVREPYE